MKFGGAQTSASGYQHERCRRTGRLGVFQNRPALFKKDNYANSEDTQASL